MEKLLVKLQNMSKSKSKETTYESAMRELQELVDQLQGEAIGIDELSGKMERARELIAYCREKLRQTEAEVDGLMGEG